MKEAYVKVVEINRVDTKSLQRLLGRRSHIFWLTAQAGPIVWKPKLSGQEDLISLPSALEPEGGLNESLCSFAIGKKRNQYLPLSKEILRVPVGVRGVPEGTPFLQRNIQHLCGGSVMTMGCSSMLSTSHLEPLFLLTSCPIGTGKDHGTKAYYWNLMITDLACRGRHD